MRFTLGSRQAATAHGKQIKLNGMLLNSELYIETDYNPSTDIIQVRMPDMSNITLGEMRYNIGALADTIRVFDIRKVLIEQSASGMSHEMRAFHTTMCVFFCEAFSNTRVERLARIQHTDAVLEENSQRCILECTEKGGKQMLVKTFVCREDALRWLA